MDAFIRMLINVLIFIALAIPGYILVKAKMLKSSETNVLSSILTHVGMPFLIISSTISITFSSDLITLFLITVGACIVLTLLVFLIAKLFSKNEKTKKTRCTMEFAMTFSNNGFLGIPLAMAVFGTTSLVLPIIIVYNIINNVLIFSIGVFNISGDKNAISLRKALLNPVLIAFIIGIILNLLNVTSYVPEVADYSEHLKNLVTPLSMLVLGIKLADIPIKTLLLSKKSYIVSFVKLVVTPVFCVAVAFLLKEIISLPIEFVLATFIAFSMPTAGLAPTLADKYNGDTENAVIFTLGNTILSIITIPLLYFALVSII